MRGRVRAARRRRSAPQWRDATIAGLLMLCCGNGAVGWAEQRVPSGLAALLVAVVPLWMVLVDWARPHGARARRSCCSVSSSGFVGLIILVGRTRRRRRPSTRHRRDRPRPRVAGVGVWIGVQSIARPAGVRRAVDRHSDARRQRRIDRRRRSRRGELAQLHIAQYQRASWVGWIYLVTFGSSGRIHRVHLSCCKRVTPAKASTYAYVNPLVAVFLGWAIAGEVGHGANAGRGGRDSGRRRDDQRGA